MVLLYKCLVFRCPLYVVITILMQFSVEMSHALATARFKPEDSDSTELSNLMESLDSFLSDEKGRAEQRIKTCESFLNNPGLTSASLKDGKWGNKVGK